VTTELEEGTEVQESTAARAESIIKAIGVVKTYDTGRVKVKALRGIDLQIDPGEMVAIMGPSGCGKTTLLNCLSGLDIIDSGQVIVEGVDLNTMSDNAKTEHRAERMGFIFQFYNLLPVLSAAENVELPLLISGSSPAESRERALAALDRVGLAEWHRHRPAQLSGGQRQRVTIARALVNKPKLILADEPTGNLDTKTGEEILQIFAGLNQEGVTLVMVTHENYIAQYANRTISMRDGQIYEDTAKLKNADI